MSERIYKLEEVNFPLDLKGEMKLAEISDLELICKWIEEFHLEAVPNDPLNDFTEFAIKKIKNNDLVIWHVNGQSVH